MTDNETVSTWNVLLEIGFDYDILSCGLDGLSFDFGNYKLEALKCLNLYAMDIVQFDGLYQTPRTMASIDFFLRQRVESREAVLALLAYNLRSYPPDLVPDWLEEGGRLQRFLPWRRDSAAHAPRSHCSVDRDWARLALKTLAQQLATVEDDETPVVVRYDGEMLSLRCAGQVTLMPAQGKAWDAIYAVTAGALRKLPKRLMHSSVDFSVWESKLGIDGCRYPLVTTSPVETVAVPSPEEPHLLRQADEAKVNHDRQLPLFRADAG